MMLKIKLMCNIIGLLCGLLTLNSCGQKTSIITPAIMTDTVIPSSTYTQIVNTSTAIPTETATITSVPIHQLQLTYSSSENNTNRVYAVPVECPEMTPPCLGEPIQLFEFTETIYNINWSPDGQRVVFDANGVGGKFDVFIADWNGENLINLTHSPEYEGEPVWSPDGKRIGYVGCVSNQSCDFISVNPDGSDPVLLLDQLKDVVNTAVWSPNGDQLLFNGSIFEPYNQIYLSSLDGSNLIKLTKDDTDHYSQVFSPDGEWVAFISIHDPEQSDYTNIFLIRPDRGNEINLTEGRNKRQGSVQWSPQGGWLTFSEATGEFSDIYIMHADGTSVIRVTRGAGHNGTPAWRLYYSP